MAAAQKNIRDLEVWKYNILREGLLYERGFNKQGTLAAYAGVSPLAEVTPLTYINDRWVVEKKMGKQHPYRVVQNDSSHLNIDHLVSRLSPQELMKTFENQYAYHAKGEESKKEEYRNIPKVKTIISFEEQKMSSIEDYFPRQFHKESRQEYLQCQAHSITILWDKNLWNGEGYFEMLLKEAIVTATRLRERSEYYELLPFTCRMLAGDQKTTIDFK
jgi:hypothetical protein